MNPVDLDTARRLIDFSGGDAALKGLADVQIKGTVALHNMLANPDIGIAYLADEVGMGKTYIALGVVTLMRYFNPMLRVLYICPSRNVQDKWEREYKGFIRNNIPADEVRIRTRRGQPASPYVNCHGVQDLLQAAASGYFADIFIGKDSFSISLSDDEAAWTRHRDRLIKTIPAHEWKGVIKSKYDVKEQYARALNYILPTFDLVVIDEAHNFKHNFESSDRNKVLSGVLGFRSAEGLIPRARHALLLSATPYDRNLNQLRNQLNMVGRMDLLPTMADDSDQQSIRECLRRFMVRRLNTLMVNGDRLTRNMYRREWRKGPRAEIQLETDEQKLVTALVQKKVTEMLTRQSDSPSFQTGLLASFESFAESTRSAPVQFDGDIAEKGQSDARDRHVIGYIADHYKKAGLGRTLPHPKMDSVVRRLTHAMFEQAKKQIVFVRRVKSVAEIKDKLDDAYNDWVMQYIYQSLKSHLPARTMMSRIFQLYMQASQKRDRGALGGEETAIELGEDTELTPKTDTFFAWFFRGKLPDEVMPLMKVEGREYTTPELVRRGLAAKNQVIVTLLEPNWAWFLCQRLGIDMQQLLADHSQNLAEQANHYISGRLADDNLEVYQACQLAFIHHLIEQGICPFLAPLFQHMSTECVESPKSIVNAEILISELGSSTFYTELEKAGVASSVIPYQQKVFDRLKAGQDIDNVLKLFDIHKALLSFVLRTSHGIIDVYMARLMQGPENLTAETRVQWMRDLVALLVTQKGSPAFSTWHELVQLAAYLELIIKNNIPEVLDITSKEYPNFLRQELNPVSPMIGASGETTGRSSQARKFRMPGYPLALVSTDVFQEGEDLHTFCDSVVHYGLSGSPVSLEQKAGRVDRVSSMAQRRLQSLERQAEESDFIQVTFPYVRESIEMLQVRQMCENINKFIESLHEVHAQGPSVTDNIELECELRRKDDIPEQILEFLHSPYDPVVDESNEYNAVDIIDMNVLKYQADVEHVRALLKQKWKGDNRCGLKEPISDEATPKIGDSELVIRLGSAKASGELLLSLTRRADPFIHQIVERRQLLELMQAYSWTTFHRTYAIPYRDLKGGYEIFFNAEMLVGGQEITQHSEIDRLFERMEIHHNPDSYQNDLPEEITAHINSISEMTTIPIDRLGESRVEVQYAAGVSTLVFHFGQRQLNRTHRVSLYACGDRCVFLSQVAPSGYSKKLSISEIIQYTWVRNRYIDLVEFTLDPNGAIFGRVVHPFDDMQWDEFIYCAYTLAVEADNLEYLLSKNDRH